jgi:Ca-activated chloride channel family protein
MRLSLPISLSLLLLSWQTALAQIASADDFFHTGAQFYLSNNIPSALEQVAAGLKVHPDDEKLKKLEELLKQKQQQQQQDQKNQNQQNQSQQQQKDQQSQQQKDDQKNQQQQNQNQQSSQKDSQDQQKQDEQKKSAADQKKGEQEKKQDQQKSSADKKDGGKSDKQDVAGQPVAPGQMTPEEAKRLLDAQKGDEQVLKLLPKGKPEDQKRPVKDW